MKLFAIAAAVLLTSCNTDTKTGKSGTTAADAGSKEKVVLRLNYPAGFKQEVIYTMHTDVAGGGAVDEQVYLTYTAAPSDDKSVPGYVFSGQVTRIKSASDVFGQKEAYDTADKNLVAADPEMAADLGKLIGKDFTFSATNKGEILKKFAFKGLAQSGLEQPVALDNYFVKFPDEAVGVGQSWNAGFKNDLTGQQISNEYTVKAIGKNEVIISLVSNIPAMKGVTKDNTLKGEYTIDRKTGMLLRAEISGTLTGMTQAEMTYTFTGKEVK